MDEDEIPNIVSQVINTIPIPVPVQIVNINIQNIDSNADYYFDASFNESGEYQIIKSSELGLDTNWLLTGSNLISTFAAEHINNSTGEVFSDNPINLDTISYEKFLNINITFDAGIYANANNLIIIPVILPDATLNTGKKVTFKINGIDATHTRLWVLSQSYKTLNPLSNLNNKIILSGTDFITSNLKEIKQTYWGISSVAPETGEDIPGININDFGCLSLVSDGTDWQQISNQIYIM